MNGVPCKVSNSLARARALCEAQGLRLTPLREQVLALILQHGKPIGAYAIMELLADSSSREQVAPPTVYRTLDFLLETRLIHKIHSINAFMGNANPTGDRSYVLFICSDCGYATETPNNTIQQAINLSASQHRFTVEGQAIEISGKCNECKKRERPSGKSHVTH